MKFYEILEVMESTSNKAYRQDTWRADEFILKYGPHILHKKPDGSLVDWEPCPRTFFDMNWEIIEIPAVKTKEQSND